MEKFTKHIESIKLKFKLILLLFLISGFYHNYYAQYSVYDYDLIKTTFERSLSRDLTLSYLKGNDDANVKAALLSIANCKDTTYLPEILKLNFKKYGEFIAFTLGQLGPSDYSSEYLFSKITATSDKHVLRYCYDALGKVANLYFYKLILNRSDYGIPLALYQFFQRKVISSKGLLLKHLFRDLLTTKSDSLKLNDILFALSRIGPDSTFIPLLTALLLDSDKHIAVQSKIYSLTALRKLQYFSPLPELLNLLLVHKDWRIRTETIKCVKYFNNLKNYETILKNPQMQERFNK